MPRASSILGLFVIAASLVAAGCGASDKTIHVSGTVLFDGNPVPAGRVDFFPDLANGNDGPQGFALIKDGKYDTRDGGQGHAGGAMVIRIEGFDGQSEDPQFPGKMIFRPFEIKSELPKEASVQNLEVPASAAKDWVPKARSPS